MFKVKYVISLSTVLLLSGCATEFRDYEGTSKRVALANVCEREGYITQEQFSYYSSFQMGSYAHQWIVDDNRLRSMYFQELNNLKKQDLKSAEAREYLKLYCGEIATVAARVKPGGTQQQTNQYTPPKTTNCMTTYGWTHCTSN